MHFIKKYITGVYKTVITFLFGLNTEIYKMTYSNITLKYFAVQVNLLLCLYLILLFIIVLSIFQQLANSYL